MNIIYAAVGSAILLFIAFVGGCKYGQRDTAQAQVTVLQHDAVELPKVQENDDARKIHDAKIIADAIAKLPKTACFVTRITADDAKRLRDGGT